MKPETRTGGIFASAACLIVTLSGYIHTQNPIQSMLYGLGASVLMGFIGYRMAFILTHPKGKAKNKAKKQTRTQHTPQEGESPLIPLTGEETFLDDVGS